MLVITWGERGDTYSSYMEHIIAKKIIVVPINHYFTEHTLNRQSLLLDQATFILIQMELYPD